MTRYNIKPDDKRGFIVVVAYPEGGVSYSDSIACEAEARAWIVTDAGDTQHTVSSKVES